MNPVDSTYDSSMYNGPYENHKVQAYSGSKQSSQDSSSGSSLNPINFTDYDDEFGNYYLGKAGSHMVNSYSNRKLSKRNQLESGSSKAVAWLMSAVPEAVDGADDQTNKRVKRQAGGYYESSYEKEPPCYGFPLEVNIKSRIKMDQVFPIFGNSQYKKCIKVGLV